MLPVAVHGCMGPPLIAFDELDLRPISGFVYDVMFSHNDLVGCGTSCVYS